jgi:hypothetical protein
MSLQIPWGSCVPTSTLVQRPGALAIEQLWHAPVQASLQHTLSTQKPVRHWSFELHVAPIADLPQLPLVQRLGETQSASLLQVERQVVAPHRNGEHSTCWGG